MAERSAEQFLWGLGGLARSNLGGCVDGARFYLSENRDILYVCDNLTRQIAL